MERARHYQVLIVGGGSGGISVAARILREARHLRQNVAILDPSDKHYYQPLWTLVGGGAVEREVTEREEASVIPEGAIWIKAAATEFKPEENAVLTAAGERIEYDYLVVAAGIQVDWGKVAGLQEAIGKNGVCSNYSYDTVASTWENIRTFRGGRAVFTQPSTPIKCAGAPQKIMYLADEHFRRVSVRDKSEVLFMSGGPAIFGVKKYADALLKVIERKGIVAKFKHDLVAIDGEKKQAVFENLESKERVTVDYDMIHVTPPMSAPDFIKQSPLANAAGWLDLDKSTLLHTRYGNIFGCGDCTSLPTSKTGAAIRKQAPVVANNLLAVMRSKPAAHQYSGYTSCPLVTGYGSLILAEFDYSSTPDETFPFDQGKERFSMYLLKKELLPVIYWDGMLKGLM
jgi:sulfide:quinone oxidoreductase